MNRFSLMYKISAILVLTVFPISGCSQKLPPDLPKLYPCEVRVLVKGEPLTDAFVGFAPAEGKWAAMGTTDGQGIAKMKTNFMYDGVAAGSYKVLITKIKEEPGKPDPSRVDPDVEGSGRILREVSLLDECFKTEKETPLEFIIEAKK